MKANDPATIVAKINALKEGVEKLKFGDETKQVNVIVDGEKIHTSLDQKLHILMYLKMEYEKQIETYENRLAYLLEQQNKQ